MLTPERTKEIQRQIKDYADDKCMVYILDPSAVRQFADRCARELIPSLLAEVSRLAERERQLAEALTDALNELAAGESGYLPAARIAEYRALTAPALVAWADGVEKE